MEEQEAEDTPSNDRRQRTPREGSYREDRVVDTPAREQGKMLDPSDVVAYRFLVSVNQGATREKGA